MEAIETSVLILRQRNPVVAQWFEPRLRAGTLAICDRLELPAALKRFTPTHVVSLVDPGNGSVHDLYFDMSNGIVDLQNTVRKYYRAKKTKAYYEGVSGYAGADELMDEVIAAVDADVNFADYDNDKDGTTEAISVVYAGQTFYFCSAGCREKFVAEPQRYLGQAPLVVGSNVKTGVRIRTDSPAEVGPVDPQDQITLLNVNAGLGERRCGVRIVRIPLIDMVDPEPAGRTIA